MRVSRGVRRRVGVVVLRRVVIRPVVAVADGVARGVAAVGRQRGAGHREEAMKVEAAHHGRHAGVPAGKVDVPGKDPAVAHAGGDVIAAVDGKGDVARVQLADHVGKDALGVVGVAHGAVHGHQDLGLAGGTVREEHVVVVVLEGAQHARDHLAGVGPCGAAPGVEQVGAVLGVKVELGLIE